MEININELNSGSYYIRQDKLSFNANKLTLTQSKFNEIKFELDYMSALEIMHTLLDSLDLLDKDTEELIYKVEDRINGNN